MKKRSAHHHDRPVAGAHCARKVGMMNTTSALTYVTDGREAIGFVLKRGRSGFEAFSREEKSLGQLFKTAPEAANAVFDAAANEEPAG
jgi:hypothetical protein